jgi:hypothetical protein
MAVALAYQQTVFRNLETCASANKMPPFLRGRKNEILLIYLDYIYRIHSPGFPG